MNQRIFTTALVGVCVVFVLALAGCLQQPDGGSPVRPVESAGLAANGFTPSEGRAEVRFSVQVSTNETAAPLRSAVRAVGSKVPTVSVCLTSVFVGNAANPTSAATYTALVDSYGIAELVVSTPAVPTVAQVQITAGAIGTFTSFRGVLDLATGANTIVVQPVNSGMVQDVAAQVVQTLVTNPGSFARAPRNLAENVLHSVAALNRSGDINTVYVGAATAVNNLWTTGGAGTGVVSLAELQGSWEFDGAGSLWPGTTSPVGYSGPMVLYPGGTLYRALFKPTRMLEETPDTASYTLSGNTLTVQRTGGTVAGAVTLSEGACGLMIDWGGGQRESFKRASVSPVHLIGSWTFDPQRTSWTGGTSPAGWSGQLIIRSDGSFSYTLLNTQGAVDSQASGRWSLLGSTLTLTGFSSGTRKAIVFITSDRAALAVGSGAEIDWYTLASRPTFGAGTGTGTGSGTGTGTGTGNHTGSTITLASGVTMTFASIPGGTFFMGCPSTEAGYYGNGREWPPHQVTLSAFAMGTTEVTQAQYLAVMNANPSYSTSDVTRPVDQVSWWDAVRFCNALSILQVRTPCYKNQSNSVTIVDGDTVMCDWSATGFRLPTDAEFEYAQRAGTTTSFFWGDSSDVAIMGQHAWYDQNTRVSNICQTFPVGQKTPNPWGLYDISGNVWELCWDWDAPSSDVGVQTDPRGPISGSHRVIRGGGFDSIWAECRSARRSRNSPGNRSFYQGFRLVRTP